MVAEFNKQHPSSVQETIDWLLQLGRPPLPECPIEAAKQGKEPKQPCFLDGRFLKVVNWKHWQNTQPIPEIYQAWFSNPKTGIGTLGGWNGKHWLGWVDFDQKDFLSPDECDRAIDQWLKQYPIVAKAPMFRTPSGGYRFLVGFSQEPQNFKANSGFSLNPNGSHHVGELLAKNGGHTLLPPTIGVSGKPYKWVHWSEYPPVVEQPEDVGLYPVVKRTENNPTATLPAKQGNSLINTDTSLREFLECDIYPRLTAEVAFCWAGHDFKAYENKLKGNCPWHDSQSGTAFYIDRKNDRFLWRCPACEIGGRVSPSFSWR
jgi:Bifunctional DNA primase/polymerase, N-terminal